MKRGRRAAGRALTFVRGCARGGLACPAKRNSLHTTTDFFWCGYRAAGLPRLGSFSPGGSRAALPLLLSGNKFSRAWASIWDKEPSFLPSLPPSWRWPPLYLRSRSLILWCSRSIILVKEIVQVANNVGPPEFQKVFEYRN